MTDTEVHWMQPGDLSIQNVPPDITSGISGRGVHVGFADGVVWFLTRDVPLDDLRKFFTVKGATRYDREFVLESYLIREVPP